MSCLEFHAWLQDRLDGGTAAAPAEVVAHRAECVACRDLDAAASRMLEGLAGLQPPRASAFLSANIVAGVIDDRRRRVRLARRRVAITVGLAASLLFLMYSVWLHQPPQLTRPGVVKHFGTPVQDEVQVPQLARQADAAREAVASLTERVADHTKEQAKFLLTMANTFDLPPMATLPSLSPFEAPLDPAAQSLRQTTQSVAEGVEPITGAARRAFSFFAKELPMFDLPQSN